MALINPDTLNLEERVVRTNKVQKTHKGGRTMSWNVLIVVGDGEGHVGAGIGKARAIPDAIRKGVEAARKNLVHVPMVGSTIPHDVYSRQSAAAVLLRPAGPGTGIVAGGSVRAILEAAGVKDILAKSLGSNNPINTAWATMHALRQLKRATDVARLRGKDVSELVPRSVVLATAAAEEHDRAAGFAEEIVPEIEVVEGAFQPEPVAEAAAATAAPEVLLVVETEDAAVAASAEATAAVEAVEAQGEANV
jgi:small subunit ribosomal protein S5